MVSRVRISRVSIRVRVRVRFVVWLGGNVREGKCPGENVRHSVKISERSVSRVRVWSVELGLALVGLVLGLGLELLGLGLWFGLGGNVRDGKCPGEMSDTPADCVTPIVLYTKVDAQCDKLVTDDRRQFITLRAYGSPKTSLKTTLAAFLFSSHPKREMDWEAHLNYMLAPTTAETTITPQE